MNNAIQAVNAAAAFLNANLKGFELTSNPDTCLSTTLQSFSFSLANGESVNGSIRVNNSILEVTLHNDDVRTSVPALVIRHDNFKNTALLTFGKGQVLFLKTMVNTLQANRLALKIRKSDYQLTESLEAESKTTSLTTEAIAGTASHKATVITTDPELIKAIQALVKSHGA